MALTDALIGDKPIKVEIEIEKQTKIVLVAFIFVITIGLFIIIRSSAKASVNKPITT